MSKRKGLGGGMLSPVLPRITPLLGAGCHHGKKEQWSAGGFCTSCGRTRNEVEIDAGRAELPRVRRARRREVQEGILFEGEGPEGATWDEAREVRMQTGAELTGAPVGDAGARWVGREKEKSR